MAKEELKNLTKKRNFRKTSKFHRERNFGLKIINVWNEEYQFWKKELKLRTCPKKLIIPFGQEEFKGNLQNGNAKERKGRRNN